MKIPFALAVTVVFLLQVGSCFMDQRESLGANFSAGFYGLFVMLFFGLNIGFLVYGRKLISIMPPSLLKRVRVVRNFFEISLKNCKKKYF